MWQEYASFHGIPLRTAMSVTRFTDVLLWREHEEQKSQREMQSHQRQDYLFASICQQIEIMTVTLARCFAGKRGSKKIKVKLADKLVKFTLKKPPEPISEMSPKEIRAARAKAAAAAKLRWGNALGLSPEVFK